MMYAIFLDVSTARIYMKGQITIPKAIRDATGFDIGDRVVVEARDDAIVLRHPRGVLGFMPPQPRTTDLSWAETRRQAREERLARQSASDGA
jgi:AbrB family looped-hinge helix DNA binding protein